MPSIRARTSASTGGAGSREAAARAALLRAGWAGFFALSFLLLLVAIESSVVAGGGRGRRVRSWGSAVAALEVGHEIGQCLGTLQRHGVVQRGAQAADCLVALQRQQAGRLRFRSEEHTSELQSR